MTREEALETWLPVIEMAIVDANIPEAKEALEMAIKALEQEPCDDAISRKKVIDTIYCECSCENLDIDFAKVLLLQRAIKALSPVTPQPKMGRWVRMSDLSEDVDDRYKCSKCGNVVHSTDRINLYTFHRWCGRCGSNNDVAKMQEVEE